MGGWGYLTRLEPSGGLGGLNERTFGSTISLSGDTLIVGQHGNDVFGENSGMAYIFTQNGDIWTQAAKLYRTDAANGELFGFRVAIDGDTAIVSDYYDNVDGEVGYESVYVYRKPAGGWSTMMETERLFPMDGEFGIKTNFGVGIIYLVR